MCSSDLSRTALTQIGTKTWKSVSTGDYHTLAIDTDGYLYAWGSGGSGKLGLGGTTNQYSPAKVGSKTWASVSAGSSHTLAIDTDGYLYAWGSGDNGKLGLGNTTSQYSPFAVGTKTWAVASAGRDHSLAIDTDGYLYSWGSNTYGQLGNGGTSSSYSPQMVGTSTWLSVSAGRYHSLGIDSSGHLYAWGYNGYGQLGLGDNTNRYTPTQVGSSTWSSLGQGLGYNFTLAIDSSGDLYSAGYNSYGGLGNGTTTNANTLQYIAHPTGGTWGAVAVGDDHSMALSAAASGFEVILTVDTTAGTEHVVTVSANGASDSSPVITTIHADEVGWIDFRSEERRVGKACRSRW